MDIDYLDIYKSKQLSQDLALVFQELSSGANIDVLNRNKSLSPRAVNRLKKQFELLSNVLKNKEGKV